MPTIDHQVSIKNKRELDKMIQGGQYLRGIKRKLIDSIKPGVNALNIEEKAASLIEQSGGKASFKMVPGYRWATCVNVNEGIVHGIPKKEIVFQPGDVVSVDVGLYFKGFHTDTSLTVALEPDNQTNKFLAVGREAIKKAISKVKVGRRIYDISHEIQQVIEAKHFQPIKDLVGHGIGRHLHEDPQIPCYVSLPRPQTIKIKSGMTFAVEVMYTQGKPDVVYEADGWTIRTRDGKIAALFEETIAATTLGPKVLT